MRQVGYLPELYEDARSEKYKKKILLVVFGRIFYNILSHSCKTLKSNFHGSVHRNIPIYIQQDATLHNLLYLETALDVSGGTTTHHQERKQLYLQQLVNVTPLLLPAAITAGSSNGACRSLCVNTN